MDMRQWRDLAIDAVDTMSTLRQLVVDGCMVSRVDEATRRQAVSEAIDRLCLLSDNVNEPPSEDCLHHWRLAVPGVQSLSLTTGASAHEVALDVLRKVVSSHSLCTDRPDYDSLIVAENLAIGFLGITSAEADFGRLKAEIELEATDAADKKRVPFATRHDVFFDWHKNDSLQPAQILNRWNGYSQEQREELCPGDSKPIDDSTKSKRRSATEAIRAALNRRKSE